MIPPALPEAVLGLVEEPAGAPEKSITTRNSHMKGGILGIRSAWLVVYWNRGVSTTG